MGKSIPLLAGQGQGPPVLEMEGRSSSWPSQAGQGQGLTLRILVWGCQEGRVATGVRSQA